MRDSKAENGCVCERAGEKYRQSEDCCTRNNRVLIKSVVGGDELISRIKYSQVRACLKRLSVSR